MPLRPILPGQLVQVPATISGVLNLKGSTNCSANPNYPSATKGDMYYVSVAGKIGGASGIAVGVGDSYTASADNAGGTQAGVGTSWFVLAHSEPAWGDIIGTLSGQTDLQTALDAKLANPAAVNVTLSDPTKTLLLGASSVPDISASSLYRGTNGAQLFISTRSGNPGPADSKNPLEVWGDFRSGSSGDSYTLLITPDCEIISNAAIRLWGLAPQSGAAAIDSAWMQQMSMDVGLGLSVIANGNQTDANGARFLTGVGIADNNGNYARNFEVGTQGTLRLNNNYGQTGSVTYSKPQIILKDIGADVGSPAATYGFIRQSASGHLKLGTYNNSSNAQGNELDITSGCVGIADLAFLELSSDGITHFNFIRGDSGQGLTYVGGYYGVHVGSTQAASGTVANGLYAKEGVSIGSSTDPGAGKLSVTGASTLTGGIVGTIAVGNATAGNVGEYVESLVAVGSPQSLSTGTAANVTSISLTAGDWDVVGSVNFTETTSTVTARSAGIGATSATLPTDGSEGYCGVQSTLTSEVNSITLQRKRVNVSSTTTVYLVAKATFSAGTCGGFGAISARRVR